ncbi:aminoacyl-tRNA deacylase [Azospirillum sp.]|uniref:aminoacyl-tRNA deacylase n=1 Tax=Azospirillum sp. TaxID=34012 RepID=UPI003D712B3E
MGIAITMEQFLDHNTAHYDLMRHAPTESSLRTAEASHIPGDCLAKGVVLKDEIGYLLAVLPATHHIRMAELEARTNRHLHLAAEPEMQALFRDCARGAVPVTGAAYGMDMIIDDSLAAQPDVYFEGGDHETLVHMDGGEFNRLFARVPHGNFSVHM